jgi:hypothetical protein
MADVVREAWRSRVILIVLTSAGSILFGRRHHRRGTGGVLRLDAAATTVGPHLATPRMCAWSCLTT